MMGAGYPGASGRPTSSMPAMANMTLPPGGMPGMPGGMPGMPGGMPKPPGAPGGGSPGGGNASKSPTVGAAEKFLDALKDKDLQKLQEAIALRAPLESAARHRTLFANIRDGQIDEATLGELSDAFAEMKVAGMNTAKSTGLRGVIVTKTEKDKNKSISRTIYVRREVAGWKVLDFSGPHIMTGYATRTKKKK
jgi:hypothetical protein